MQNSTKIAQLLQAALARLDPRDILNFPECAQDDVVDRPFPLRTPDQTLQPRGSDAD